MKKTLRIVCVMLVLTMLCSSLCPAAAAEAVPIAVTAAQTELKLNCRSAILIEQTTGRVLYEKNPSEKLPIASVTKIMTLLLAMEALEAGTIRLDQSVPISENAASMGGSQVYLEPGEEISLHEILKAVFVSSANDGAVALAELISGSVESFVALMNEKAAALGMHDSVFYNPTGLDDGETNLSTAHDVALMSAALCRFEKVKEYSTIWIDSIRGGAFSLANTNKLIRFYRGATGLKTGSTAKAKYCLSATAEREGLRLCAVVLAGETSQDRFQAAKTLLDHGFAGWAYYEPKTLSLPQIPITGGKEKSVGTRTTAGGILLAKADSVGLECRITPAEELKAPVEAGQVVGTVQYCKGESVVHEVPLFAEKSVEALGFSDLFRLLLRFLMTGQCE